MANLRNGMWVMHGDKPAIHVKFIDQFNSEVHYVDTKTGITTLVVAIPTSELKQAKYEQIPIDRRPKDLDYAKSKGYNT